MWAAYQDKEISTIVEEAVAAHLDALDRDRAARRLHPMPSRGSEAERPPGGPVSRGGATRQPAEDSASVPSLQRVGLATARRVKPGVGGDRSQILRR